MPSVRVKKIVENKFGIPISFANSNFPIFIEIFQILIEKRHFIKKHFCKLKFLEGRDNLWNIKCPIVNFGKKFH